VTAGNTTAFLTETTDEQQQGDNIENWTGELFG
jgi:hypothetical protein